MLRVEVALFRYIGDLLSLRRSARIPAGRERPIFEACGGHRE